jgi:hypothetical protein
MKTLVRQTICIISLAALMAVVGATELVPLSDDAMSDIDGGEGIALNVDFVINAYLDKDTDTITEIPCPAGVPDCRLALEFNDMDGAWLVLKDYYGAFSLNRVWLDANRTPSTASGYCDAACQSRFAPGFDANDRPVVQLSYDHSDIGLAAAYYGDGNLFYEISRITAEFGSNGYLTDNVSGAALGVRVSDSSAPGTASAQVRFDGRMQLYGF